MLYHGAICAPNYEGAGGRVVWGGGGRGGWAALGGFVCSVDLIDCLVVRWPGHRCMDVRKLPPLSSPLICRTIRILMDTVLLPPLAHRTSGSDLQTATQVQIESCNIVYIVYS